MRRCNIWYHVRKTYGILIFSRLLCLWIVNITGVRLTCVDIILVLIGLLFEILQLTFYLDILSMQFKL